MRKRFTLRFGLLLVTLVCAGAAGWHFVRVQFLPVSLLKKSGFEVLFLADWTVCAAMNGGPSHGRLKAKLGLVLA